VRKPANQKTLSPKISHKPANTLLKFRPLYFIITILLFIIEVLIALFLHDEIIRPYVGDFLVVILIYCFLRSFLNVAVLPTAIFVLVFSYTLEVLQYFNLVELLGLQQYKLARIVIGTSFEWIDLLAYTLGVIFVLYLEKTKTAKRWTGSGSKIS
jgi:glucose-6-phosphate-specific signal transduction histidine kinase